MTQAQRDIIEIKDAEAMEQKTGGYEKKAKMLSVLQIAASSWKGRGAVYGPTMFYLPPAILN